MNHRPLVTDFLVAVTLGFSLGGCRPDPRDEPSAWATAPEIRGAASGTSPMPINQVPTGRGRKPGDGEEVLERFGTASSGLSTPLAQLESGARENPHELSRHLALAEAYLEKSQLTSDPRFLSQAESALRPWLGGARPPAPVLVLRALARQARHDFDGALDDLDAALKIDPRNPQAWLSRAAILQVQGKLEEAKKSALPLVSLGSELAAVTAMGSVASVTGTPASSYALLNTIANRHRHAPVTERAWVYTILAELGAALQLDAEAEANFKHALALKRTPFLICAYADWLLDHGRPAEVRTLLRHEPLSDSYLLRLALAEKYVTPLSSASQRLTQMLADRFQAAQARHDTRHLREEARFALHVANDPPRALRLATENWKVQREIPDARIFLESAEATGDVNQAMPVFDWISAHGIRHAQLRRWMPPENPDPTPGSRSRAAEPSRLPPSPGL